jgi:zinc/manganese transport system substrate-binding protein
VVASFSILADMAREVGGDAVDVTALVGPDGDAHVFEPTPADVKRLSNADLVIVNGLRFEGWIERLVQVSGYRGPVVVASKGITTRLLGPAPDPHAWQSLANARRYVDNIRAALVAARPSHAAHIEQRSADYLQRVDALDASVRKRLGQVAPADRRVVTSHDAFGYFAEAYDVTFISAVGWSTGSEASAADVSRIVRQLRAQNVRAVFVENISDPRLVQRIAHEAGARVGGTLYSDALSPPGTAGDTYLRMFDHNASTLLAALQVRAP